MAKSPLLPLDSSWAPAAGPYLPLPSKCMLWTCLGIDQEARSWEQTQALQVNFYSKVDGSCHSKKGYFSGKQLCLGYSNSRL